MKDRIIIWENGNFFTFLLANSLQNQYEAEIYAIIDATYRRRKFYENQKFVKFEKTWFYHDHVFPHKNNIDTDYLKSFEEKYNINLWILAQNERLFNQQYNEFYNFKQNEILAILENECRLFDNILSEVKPNYLITLETTLHHHHLFYEMCKSANVTVLMLYHSKFGHNCLISENFYQLDIKENLNHIESRNRNFNELQEYLKKNSLGKQLVHHKNAIRKSKKDKIRAAFEYISQSSHTTKTNYGYYGRSKAKVLTKFIITTLKRRYREHYINKNLKHEIPKGKPFIYFSLHQDPERVLLIEAPLYTNQLEIIKNIAKSLPIGYSLYVKEHPTQVMRDWRPITFYKELLKIPNIELLHPSVNNEEILKKCSLVITISGTGSLEAAFYKKPSIIFTNLGYSILPSVTKINSIQDLPNVIRSSLKKEVNSVDLDKYLTLLEQNFVKFDIIGYFLDYENHFYYGGHLLDVDISNQKMTDFLKKYKLVFDSLANEYLKKIKQLKT